MSDVMARLDEFVHESTALLRALRGHFEGRRVPRHLADRFAAFERFTGRYVSARQRNDVDSAIKVARTLALQCAAITQAVRNASQSEEEIALSLELQNVGQRMVKRLDEDPEFYETLLDDESSALPLGWPEQHAATREREIQFVQLDERLGATTAAIDELRQQVGALKATVIKETESAAALYEDAANAIGEKSGQIDKLLGHASGRTLAGDFDNNATRERSTAEVLRVGSLLCMSTIVALVWATFYEGTSGQFAWQVVLSRVALAFFLSIPAGYLARESSRHRQQQYIYLQTSLSLKALPAYIATLPDEMQHQLKAEMTQRIFSLNAGHGAGVDQGVPNLQAIMLEVIRKLGERKS